MALFGCGDNKTPENVKNAYDRIIALRQDNGTNEFFSDSTNPYTISLAYSDKVINLINSTNPSTDQQKMYTALKYQQIMLKYIYNFYENNHVEFYKVIPSNGYDNARMNSLYAKTMALESKIEDFAKSYTSFLDDNETGNVMIFSIKSYTYELNKLIECSFDFIDEFSDIYGIYCRENNEVTPTNLQLYIDISYIDIAKIIYLENIKSFNYEVNDKGICDLLPIIKTNNSYNLTGYLTNTKRLSTAVLNGLAEKSDRHEETVKAVNDFLYYKDMLKQRFNSYLSAMESIDFYTLSQYRFNLVSGVSYDSYISSRNATERASINMLNNYIGDIFKPFIEKFNMMVA